ncbi:aspartyl-phosphate phosphatase Spo0E family protein [Clostridium paraputrificum]|uniref:aspartyl-phosphate phosphatase Spo0E family protein n=1 Tax=Clostridium TaxID=1485 RepID=UPI003D33A7EB
MKDIERMERKIEELREELQRIINKTTSLVDDEVVVASQNLDDALNEYNDLIKHQ